MSVIYAIKNLVNNKMYIGSSKSPKRRKHYHFYNLKKGNHHSVHLQRAYDKYGKDMFSFYILEECDESERLSREIFNISNYKTHEREYGYNVMEPDGHKFCCSEATKLKLSEVNNPTKIKVDLYTTEGVFISTHDSIQECSRACGFGRKEAAHFHSIVKGKRNCYKGYVVVKHGEPFNYVKSPKSRDMVKFRKS